MAKNIFVMGGVLSSLGKGIAASSIGFLLKRMGYKVGMQKFDPYLNVDPGTMSPYQHGEVFVTDDGTEADLDLGHYERFIGACCNKNSNATSGQIYARVIDNERKGVYLGKTVQVIPHITDEIKNLIRAQAGDNDFVITEIGGTVGDIESLPYLEALRQYRQEVGPENSMFVFLTYVPYIKAAGELKTKPTQHSVNKLREIGIQPDILLCRSEQPLDDDVTAKIALFTNVPSRRVINAIDVPIIYEVPLHFYKAGLHRQVCEYFRLDCPETLDFGTWQTMVDNMRNPVGEVTIAVCGKYVVHKDAYKSVESALVHAAASHRLKLKVKWVDSEVVTEDNVDDAVAGVQGVLVPGGFGVRGIDGKICIARKARELGIPYFGICLGMQVAVIEFAQHVCGLTGAYSTEFNPEATHPVIHIMEEQKYIALVGGTMRLGSYPCQLKPGSLAQSIYGSERVDERHRHRFEFNNDYRETLTKHGLSISGTSPDGMLVEVCELPDHPFFIGVQYHPEFKSRPEVPHPIYAAFIKAAAEHKA